MVTASINPNHAIRVFYFGLGAGTALAAYFEFRRMMWAGAKSVAVGWGTYQPASPAAAGDEREELLLGPKARAAVAREWNKMVDSTLGALAQELGRRGI